MKRIGLLSFLLLSMSNFLHGMNTPFHDPNEHDENKYYVLVGLHDEEMVYKYYYGSVFKVTGTEVSNLTAQQKNQAIPAVIVTNGYWRPWGARQLDKQIEADNK